MRIYFILILFLSPFLTRSQYFSTGQDPASVKWKQIKTKYYRLVFPSDYEKQSQYMANILELLHSHETKTLSSKVPRMPILVHTQSVISNGLTVWAPRRIELYTCPPQDSYAEEWLEQLVIHEYRHAVQISKMNRGFTHFLYYLFGEQVTGGVLGLYIPPWFLEGDATATETALTNTGRGRTYSFENILRAQLLEKGIYSYDKAVLGSYITFTPDEYELGYPLVAQGRREYGTGLWNMALDQTAKYPFMIVPFAAGIKKVSGLTKTEFYNKMLSDLSEQWKIPVTQTFTPLHHITPEKSGIYTSYVHPVVQNDSTIISEKEVFGEVDWIVSINRFTGKEKKLIAMGYSFDESISVSGNYFVWSERDPDPRWQNRDYSLIRIYDLVSHKDHYLTHKSRYFAPNLSPDSKEIAAVRTDTQNHSYIDILDRRTGKVLKSFPMKDNELAMTPNWSPDGQCLIFTLLKNNGKTLTCLKINSGIMIDYLPATYREISGPAYMFRSYVIFTADYSGVSGLYAIDTLSMKIYQVINSRFSSKDPDFSPDKKKIIYLDYNADGYKIVEANLDPEKWIPLQNIKDLSIHLYDSITSQENTNIQDAVLSEKLYKLTATSQADSIPPGIQVFKSKRYSKLLNLFNPHSWAPASIDINNITLKPGISLLSQNLLSTMITTTGYEYDVNERTGKFYLDLSYRGLYPVFDVLFDYGKRASFYSLQKGGELLRYTYNELNLKGIVSQPLDFSRGRNNIFMQPSVGITLIALSADPSTPRGFHVHDLQSVDYRMFFSRTVISGIRDVYPKWGQVVDINFRNTPFKVSSGEIFSAEGSFYLPGFVKHHGILVNAGWQERVHRSTDSYLFSNMISYPRGYSEKFDNTLISASINYKFPLFYPDFSVSSLIYFKRFKMNIFYDYSEGRKDDKTNYYNSTGAELTADLHLLRFVYPFELGIRSIYLPGLPGWRFEFLYSVSF